MDRAYPIALAGDLVLGDPPRVTGRGEVVEQRPADVPRGRIASGGVRGTARALSEVVDGPLEDVEAQAVNRRASRAGSES